MCLHPRPMFAYLPILFFHQDFINGVLFLFVALLTQKLDPEKHDPFLAEQRANGQSELQKKINTSCSKKQIHVSYFFKPHAVLMSLYIRKLIVIIIGKVLMRFPANSVSCT